MIKKIVIAAAGKGTRMKHLSKNKPKHLIKVLGKPFLYYLLTVVKKAGFKDIILVTGYKKEVMEQFIAQWNNHFDLILVNQYDYFGSDDYGTALPIRCVKEIIGSEDFVAVYGDNLYSVRDLKRMRQLNDYNYVSGLTHPNPARYGILLYDQNNFLKKIVEKPKTFINNIINTGLYKFTPEIFSAAEQIKKSDKGEYYLTDAISLLARKKRVKVQFLKDFWLDFGNPGDIPRLTRFLKENNILKPL
jgi:dTDP-glucose pyrophosphorylase